jgi:hypothetical protein
MVRVVAFLLFHYRPAGPGRMGSAVKRSAQERRLRQLLFSGNDKKPSLPACRIRSFFGASSAF